MGVLKNMILKFINRRAVGKRQKSSHRSPHELPWKPQSLAAMRFERRLFTIKDSKFTLDLTIRAFNQYRIRAATIYWRYRFRPHAAVRSLPALDQPRDHWRPKNFVRAGINDTSIEPRLRWDNVILVAFHS